MRALSVVLLLLSGCDADKSPFGGGGGGGSAAFDSVEARLSTGVNTVVIVDFTMSEAADRTWIEYGPTTGYGFEAPMRSEGHAVVLGLAPDSEVHLRVGAEIDGALEYSADQVVQTGTLPGAIPGHNIEDAAPSEAFGEFVMTSYFASGPGESGVLILNREGDVVWYTTPQEGFTPAARPARDGQSILYLWNESVTHTDTARICRVDLDGESETCTNVPYGHHDFAELPDGSFVYPQEVFGTWNDYSLIGDALVHQDTSGETTELWNAFDDIPPVVTPDWSQHILPDGVDWTHVNGIWHDEAKDDWYLSFYFFEEIRKIPADTGTTEWVLGGLENEFRFRGATFGPQHAPQLIDGGIMLFDNSSQQNTSRVAAYQLDEDGREATETLSFENPDGIHAAVMGDAHLLPNGYVAAAFGDGGQVVVYTPEGDPVWQMTPSQGVSAAQVYVYDDLYTMYPN